jgi:hypothetical protein
VLSVVPEPINGFWMTALVWLENLLPAKPRELPLNQENCGIVFIESRCMMHWRQMASLKTEINSDSCGKAFYSSFISLCKLVTRIGTVRVKKELSSTTTMGKRPGKLFSSLFGRHQGDSRWRGSRGPPSTDSAPHFLSAVEKEILAFQSFSVIPRKSFLCF